MAKASIDSLETTAFDPEESLLSTNGTVIKRSQSRGCTTPFDHRQTTWDGRLKSRQKGILTDNRWILLAVSPALPGHRKKGNYQFTERPPGPIHHAQ
ncbi:hypothetical protein FOPE_00720 [Fonsecaea pedrosoi]|nr:hypothetical protein FOPE_00720 [Fonsecaea pedrosoi]